MNLPAWLLVFFAFIAGMCLSISFNITSTIVTNPEKSSCFQPIPDVDATTQSIFLGFQATIFGVLYPLIGWLTDTIFGRERAIKLQI